MVRHLSHVRAFHKRGCDHEIRSAPIAGHRHVPNDRHAKESLDVGIVRLRLKQIPEKGQQVEVTLRDHGSDLLVTHRHAAEATELFTPADIEFSADKAAQRAFEREHFSESSGRATTREFLFAIKRTRPSLTEDAIETFRNETKTFARD